CIACPRGELLQFLENGETLVADKAREIGATNLCPYIDNRLRQFRFAALQGRFGHGDASRALPTKLDRYEKSKVLLRCFPLDLSVNIGIRPLLGNRDACETHGAAPSCGGDRRVRVQGPIESRVPGGGPRRR